LTVLAAVWIFIGIFCGCYRDSTCWIRLFQWQIAKEVAGWMGSAGVFDLASFAPFGALLLILLFWAHG
jgi:hypothetical protein